MFVQPVDGSLFVPAVCRQHGLLNMLKLVPAQGERAGCCRILCEEEGLVSLEASGN